MEQHSRTDVASGVPPDVEPWRPARRKERMLERRDPRRILNIGWVESVSFRVARRHPPRQARCLTLQNLRLEKLRMTFPEITFINLRAYSSETAGRPKKYDPIPNHL